MGGGAPETPPVTLNDSAAEAVAAAGQGGDATFLEASGGTWSGDKRVGK